MSPSGTLSNTEQPDEPDIRRLLQAANWDQVYRLKLLGGGRNNRTFRLETQGGAAFLKWYFAHPTDTRDRLAAEYAFCRFCWDRGIGQVPRPLACDRLRQLGLFEFVEGQRLSSDDVTSQHVEAAVEFYHAVNSHGAEPAAAELPLASEACFSIRQHLECIERRVERLRGIAANTEFHQAAEELVRVRLHPMWRRLRAAVGHEVGAGELSLDEMLDRHERCLSPSDFGFHNAIVQQDGSLRFVDFEYAGWDDPAKLISDFFCQVEVPVPRQFLAPVLASLAAPSSNADRLRHRTELLLPAYRLKWCCIVLNEFLPTGDDRRSFSGAPAGRSRYERQLALGNRLLDELDGT